MSDRICLMCDGHIEQIGTPYELYREPHSHFVADFLGESNFLEGTIARGGENASVALPLAATVEVPSRFAEQPGDPVLVMLRPEALHFVDDEAWSGNRLEGRIVDATFMGSVMRYEVSVGAARDVVVKELTQSAVRRRGVGERATIGWRTDDGVLLRAERA
jgi:ABC-type Fe3+/spermidine/putrescine transport system ATPase subunit